MALAYLDRQRCSTGLHHVEQSALVFPRTSIGLGCAVAIAKSRWRASARCVVVGARTRVQSHAFICELVTIGEDCFVGHGVMFVNDTFSTGGPARGNKDLWRETVIGNRVSIGSNATIMPVRIADDVVIGAGAVVTRDITTSGTYAGNPARRLPDK